MFKQFSFYINIVKTFSYKSFYAYIFISTLSSLLQSLGIVSILPLVTILTNPDNIINNEFFRKFYFLTFESNEDLIIQFSFLFLICNIVAIVSFFLTFIFGEYCTANTVASLKIKIFKLFADNDLKSSSQRSNLQNYINFELQKFRSNLLGIMNLFQSVITIFIFLISIFIIKFEIFYGVLVIILFYIIVYFFQKKILIKLSFEQSDLSKKIQQISLFFILAIKDTLALNLGNKLVKALQLYQNTALKLYIKSLAYTTYPRYLFEILIYTLMVLGIFIFYQNEPITNDIPIYATLALFTWKSIPLVFNIYRVFALMRTNESTFKKYSELTKDLKQKKPNIKAIKSFKTINLKNIKFSFSQEKKFNYEIFIKDKDKILITGKSGSGKTTLLNIISGILLPDSGDYFINNKKINLQKYYLEFVGYVTQNPILFPGTVFENITFASKKKYDVDLLKKVFDVCDLSQITDYKNIQKKFLEFDSPELSGGQKQRLGIARILYTNPQLLILDESTSSLDKVSEIKIFDNIIKKFNNLTLICVSHRPQKNLFSKVIKI